MNSSVSQNYSFPELDRLCPICLSIPSGKIFQCKNGHTFCKSCSNTLTQCPVCASPLLDPESKPQDEVKESAHNAMKLSCPNKKYGCSEMTIGDDIKTHIATCAHTPVHLCKHLGFLKCEYVATESSIPEFIAHLKTAHETEISILQNQSSKIFPTSPESAKNVWTIPILFDLSTEIQNEYVIVTPHAKSNEKKDLELWFTAVYMGHSKAESYELMVELSKWNDDMREINEAECRQPVVPIDDVAKNKTKHFIKYRVHHEESNAKAFIKVGVKRKPSSDPKDTNNKNLVIDSAVISRIIAATQTVEADINALTSTEDLTLSQVPTKSLSAASFIAETDPVVDVSMRSSVIRTIFFSYFVVILAASFLAN